MGRLEPKHWALIGGFLVSFSIMIGGLDHWSDATHPAFVAGFVGQLGVLLGALFAGAPQNPNLSALANPGRRDTDPLPVAAVADLLRKTP